MATIRDELDQEIWHAPATVLRMRSIACLMLGDIAAIVAGFLLTWLGRPDFAISRTPLFMIVLVAVYLVVAASVDAFDTRSLRDPVIAITLAIPAMASAGKW